MKIDKKLAELVERELPKLLDDIILKDGKQHYRVFGSYTVENKQGYYLVYQQDQYIGQFGSSRSAIAWCIADKHNRIILAKQIQILDEKINRLRQDIDIRHKIAEKATGEFWETVSLKTAYRREQSRLLETQLTNCVNSAKYLQLRGNSNETKRISSSTTY